MVFPAAKKVMAFPVQARAGACDSWTRSPAAAARLNPSGKNDSGVARVLLGCDGALHAMCRTTVAIDTGARRQRCQDIRLRYWSCDHTKKAMRFFGVRCFYTRRRMRVRRCPMDAFREPFTVDASGMSGRVGIIREHGNIEGATVSGQLAASGRAGGCRICGAGGIRCRKPGASDGSCPALRPARLPVSYGGPGPTLRRHRESSCKRLARSACASVNGGGRATAGCSGVFQPGILRAPFLTFSAA